MIQECSYYLLLKPQDVYMFRDKIGETVKSLVISTGFYDKQIICWNIETPVPSVAAD